MVDFIIFVKNNRVKQGIWKNVNNHKIYAIWLGEKLGYTNMEDWYKINSDIISKNYGGGLLCKYYNGSCYSFLKSIFPDYEWLGWKFPVSPYNFWNLETEKKYAIWLGKIIGYKNIEDWYKITRKLIIRNFGGGYILKKYNGSPNEFVKSVFSEYNWLDWKFLVTPCHFWGSNENQINYANWLGKILGYKNMDDWYNLRVDIIKKYYGSTLILNYYNGSPYKFIKSVFPEYNWIKSKFPKKYSIGQIEWLEFIKISTPDIRYTLNHPEGEFKIPNSNYLADGYSKIKNCIYEYHGDFWHGNPVIYNSNDINQYVKKTYGELYSNTLKKQICCEEKGFMYKSIWESEWIRGKKSVVVLQKIYKKYLYKTHKIYI